MLGLAWALLLTLDASADCADIPNLIDELPKERRTPNQTQLAFVYDLGASAYSVSVRREGESFRYEGLPLQGNCHPGTLAWESDDFVGLERGCGTFCWGVDVLATTTQRRVGVFRPLAFIAERQLVISYPEWDTIGVTSLATGHVQSIPTARHCQSSAEVCFSVGVEGNSLVYVWQDGSPFSVPLDRRLFD